MDNKLFRNKAIENQTMPERLDHSLKLTKPRYWIAVLAGIVVIVSLIIWGFVGTINSSIDVYGYYLTAGITNSNMISESAQVVSINNVEGKIVHKGDVVFTYKNSSGEIKEDAADSTGIVVKNNLTVGQQLMRGQETYSLRAFIVKENGKQVLYDDSTQKNSEVNYSNIDKKIYLYVPSSFMSSVELDQEVLFKDNSGNYMQNVNGKISKVKKSMATEDEIASITGLSMNSKTVSEMTNGTFCECEIEISKNGSWPYNEGDMLQASIITGKTKPISLIFPNM